MSVVLVFLGKLLQAPEQRHLLPLRLLPVRLPHARLRHGDGPVSLQTRRHRAAVQPLRQPLRWSYAEGLWRYLLSSQRCCSAGRQGQGEMGVQRWARSRILGRVGARRRGPSSGNGSCGSLDLHPSSQGYASVPRGGWGKRKKLLLLWFSLDGNVASLGGKAVLQLKRRARALTPSARRVCAVRPVPSASLPHLAHPAIPLTHPPSSCEQHKAAAAAASPWCVGEMKEKRFPTIKEQAEIGRARIQSPIIILSSPLPVPVCPRCWLSSSWWVAAWKALQRAGILTGLGSYRKVL